VQCHVPGSLPSQVTVLPSHCEWAHNSDLGSSSLSSCLDRGGLFDSSFEGVFEKREGVCALVLRLSRKRKVSPEIEVQRCSGVETLQ